MDKLLQVGFTFIELIIVIVVLGILAAVAVPKFLNVSSNAQQAAVNTIAGALGAASATNYGVRSASSSQGSAISNCQNVGSLLPGGSLPSGYTITSQSITAGTDATCTVTRTSGGQTATFTATGIS